jgi:hypothetical protein
MDIYNGRPRKSCALQTSVLAHTLSQLSCIVAIIGAFLLVDFPERAHRSWKFLTEAECAFIIRRVNKDRGDATAEEFSMGKFLRPALDLKIWGFALIFL